jgi:tetratricopeptide (TPR) repeat protein
MRARLPVIYSFRIFPAEGGLMSFAIAAFEEAIKLNPSFAAAHVLLGQMYLYAGRREEAIERVEKGIRQRCPPARITRPEAGSAKFSAL